MAISVVGAAAASSGSNNFTILVGATGNNNYILDTTYPAGTYKITFINGDTTYDIYAISETGTFVGYTNNTRIDISAKFKELSILGAATNERVTFVYEGAITTPSSAGDVPTAGAYITAISDTTLVNQNDSAVITGGNFASDVMVTFTGTDSVARSAKTIVRSSSTSLIITRPDLMPPSASPYTVSVLNPGIPAPTGTSAHLLSNSVTSGGTPTWTTTSLPFFTVGTAYTATLVASDVDSSITYSIVSGSLPTGFTLNGATGVISGTTSSTGGFPLTFRATDGGGNYLDKAISVIEMPPATIPLTKMVAASTTTTRVTSGTSFTVPSTEAGGYYVVATVVGGGGAGGSEYTSGGGKGNAAGVVTAANAIKYAPGAAIAFTIGSGGVGVTTGSATNNLPGNQSTCPAFSLTAAGAVGNQSNNTVNSSFSAGGTYSWRPTYTTYSGGGSSGSQGGTGGTLNGTYGVTGNSGSQNGGNGGLGCGGGAGNYESNNSHKNGDGGAGFIEFYLMPASAYVY
jgi:hypothetical protein